MNEEIDALLKMADKSIRGARLLFEDGLYGFAVSRSYYAMFYHWLPEQISLIFHGRVRYVMISIFWYGGIYCIRNIKFVKYSRNKSKVCK